jgi:hypothetical protein
LYNTLIRWCLAGKPSEENEEEQGHQELAVLKRGSVISSATTGVAALLLIGGGTVHRQFFVPNDVDEDTAPRISYESSSADRLRAVELIIIDV